MQNWNCYLDKEGISESMQKRTLEVFDHRSEVKYFSNVFRALSYIFDTKDFPGLTIINPEIDEAKLFVEEFLRLRKARKKEKDSKILFLQGANKTGYHFNEIRKPICLPELIEVINHENRNANEY